MKLTVTLLITMVLCSSLGKFCQFKNRILNFLIFFYNIELIKLLHKVFKLFRIPLKHLVETILGSNRKAS